MTTFVRRHLSVLAIMMLAAATYGCDQDENEGGEGGAGGAGAVSGEGGQGGEGGEGGGVEPCVCPDIYAPVCGADGETYGNACVARCAEVEVAHEGECEAEPVCGEDRPCEDGQVCNEGVCVEDECGCPKNYAPVCGVDGETYGNECMARCAGVEIAARGECEPEPECGADRPCEAGQVCTDGVCVDEGCACPEIYAPVCGVDGETYGNDCEARCAGVRIAHEGECEAPPIECDVDGPLPDREGARRPAPRACPPGLVCQDGFCIEREECVCPDVWMPVCGANGETYGNACEARCAGVEVVARGECEPEPIECDVDGPLPEREGARRIAPRECPPGLICQDGLCVEREECACPDVWMPVCGVDGETYGNACEARCAGVEVAAQGECEAGPIECGGPLPPRDAARRPAPPQECPPGLVCQDGLCVEVEECVCPAVWAPVCGVDGETYGNRCEARCAGVRVAHEGECEAGPIECDIDGPLPEREGARRIAPRQCPPGLMCIDGLCVEGGDCLCPDIWAPVCGVDGETYGNGCEARCAGVEIDHDGECNGPIFCDERAIPLPGEDEARIIIAPGGDCPAGMMCEDGICVENEICLCPATWEPVCGVDGETYGNACEARCAGIRIDHPGECEVGPIECDIDRPLPEREGARLRAPRLCPPGLMCIDGFCIEGECLCLDVWEPVCGVDGETYGNGCQADCAGVEIEHEGECEAGPIFCDEGIGPLPGEAGARLIAPPGGDCPAGMMCEDGVCVEGGECLCPRDYNPVCGVDGETYGNACEAGCADVEIAYQGECENQIFCEEGPVGLPREEAAELIVVPGECPPGLVCEDGVCVEGGECLCPAVLAPVCGVDGETYDNACEAGCAGVEIAHPGLCDRPIFCNEAGELPRREGARLIAILECPDGMMCEDGVCVDNGECICPAIHAPVCGEDGETYGNACQAGCAGVAIAHPGNCEMRCEQADDCPPGFRCDAGGCLPCADPNACGGNACPDPEDPQVSYISRDPAQCAVIRFQCEPGAEGFSNECGCGCITPEPACGEGQIEVDGVCQRLCHGPEECGRGQVCNAAEVCLPDPTCRACDVCAGWCEFAPPPPPR